MTTKFRNYTNQPGITEDYFKVREFLLGLGYSIFPYSRWDWMITHGYMDKSSIGKIGVWEENSQIIGIATYDCQLGNTYFVSSPQHSSLKKEMLLYAKDNLGKDKEFNAVILERTINRR